MSGKVFQPALLGWWQAFLAVFIFQALSYNLMRSVSAVNDIDPLVYSCCLFIGSAFSLLIFGRHGRISSSALRQPHTWIYGICLIGMFAINMFLLKTITSTELVLIHRITMLVGIIASAVFLLRSIGYDRWLGGLFVLIGILIILAQIEPAKQFAVYSAIGVIGIIGALRIFMAELHPDNHEPRDYASRCKLAGMVTAFTGLMFTAIGLLIAYLQTLAVAPVAFLPEFADFQNRVTIYFGLLQGAILIAPLRYLEFSSVRLIKSENFLAVVALVPVATLLWELLFAGAGLIDVRRLNTLTLIAGALITFGALFTVYIRIRREMGGKFDLLDYMVRVSQEADKAEQALKKEEKAQRRRLEDTLQASMDSREIVLDTMQRYHNYVPKVADLLGLPENVVEAVVNDANNELTLRKETLNSIARNYRRNVVPVDPLTGLKNRLFFDNQLARGLLEYDKLAVFFIDLDKFKPVNDTYGHEVGDKLLQSVGNRLDEFISADDVAARLGGDEYGLIIYGIDPATAQEVAQELKALICQPYQFSGLTAEVIIGASIGVSNYPGDGQSASDLLKAADKAMYAKKSSR